GRSSSSNSSSARNGVFFLACRGASSSKVPSASGAGGSGTVITAAHLGHLTFLPASAALGSFMLALHWGQVSCKGMAFPSGLNQGLGTSIKVYLLAKPFKYQMQISSIPV